VSLAVIEQEEEDRIQYELQLSGQGGRRLGMWAPGRDRDRNLKPERVRVEAREDYILTLEKVSG
jgi:hypothetical protein